MTKASRHAFLALPAAFAAGATLVAGAAAATPAQAATAAPYPDTSGPDGGPGSASTEAVTGTGTAPCSARRCPGRACR